MHKRFSFETNPVVWRWINHLLPVLLLVLLLPRAEAAPQARQMSPSVVLVLKLVSSTHVKPATGIVISDDGLVLVPVEFASPEGEIIVLDGGTDIVKHGRPASVVKDLQSGNFAVLSVKGLSRPGITLSDKTPDIQTGLHLAAFPTAEDIAKGAPPLWVPVSVIAGESDSQFTISPETPLPYVSGPILDPCGYLVGVNVTTGPQGVVPDETSVAVFAAELRRTFDGLKGKLPEASCNDQVKEATMAVPEPQSPEAVIETSDLKEQSTEVDKSGFIRPEVYNPVVKKKRLNPFQGARRPPGGSENPGGSSLWLRIPLWVLVFGFTAMLVMIWKAAFLLRLVRGDAKPDKPGAGVHGIQAASEEPDTSRLLDTAGWNPRSAPVDDLEQLDMDARPAGCDGVMVLDGFLDAETPFKRFCFVDTNNVSIVIGRGDAEIRIEHPAISRSHARVEADSQSMTISDLGSSNGTFIRDIPCLPGEVMFIDQDEEIFLGEVRFRIQVIRQEATLA